MKIADLDFIGSLLCLGVNKIMVPKAQFVTANSETFQCLEETRYKDWNFSVLSGISIYLQY